MFDDYDYLLSVKNVCWLTFDIKYDVHILKFIFELRKKSHVNELKTKFRSVIKYDSV